MCVCVSEPPVWLRPARRWEHGEGGWALETSSLTAPVCGGGTHPAEQVTQKPRDLCFESGLPFTPFVFITLYLFLSDFSHGFLSHWFSHSLMGVILFIAPFLSSSFSGSSLISCCSPFFFILFPSLCLMTELFIQARCWRLCVRVQAAPASPGSTLFMWSTSSFAPPSLTVVAATFPSHSHHLQALCRSSWLAGN